jgi:hypothetical protein
MNLENAGAAPARNQRWRSLPVATRAGLPTTMKKMLTTAGPERERPQDAEAAIGDLPAGLTVGVSVTARNAAGESQPTDAVQIVVP